MAYKSYPFDDGDGSQVTQADWRGMGHAFHGSRAGVSGHWNGQQLKVDPVTGKRAVTLKTGTALMNGFTFVNDTALELEIEANGTPYPRIDVVILELDFTAKKIVPKVKKGLPTQNPVPPDLRREWSFFEFPLARVTVAPAAVSIPGNGVVDVREFLSPGLYTAGANGRVDQPGTGTLWFNPDKSELRLFHGGKWRWASTISDNKPAPPPAPKVTAYTPSLKGGSAEIKGKGHYCKLTPNMVWFSAEIAITKTISAKNFVWVSTPTKVAGYRQTLAGVLQNSNDNDGTDNCYGITGVTWGGRWGFELWAPDPTDKNQIDLDLLGTKGGKRLKKGWRITLSGLYYSS